MFEILEKKQLNDTIFQMVVRAERVAKNCLPGQFVIVRMDDDGERIPLTICDYDKEAGTITIVFQVVGAETKRMTALNKGDYFRDFVGPLGRPSELCEEEIASLKQKRILFVAGGVGTAPVYPQVKWLREQGVAADVIVGAKTKDILIMEEEMKARGTTELSGENAFKLYDTFGFPTDLTQEILAEKGFTIDEAGFGVCMQHQRDTARKARPLSPNSRRPRLMPQVDTVTLRWLICNPCSPVNM